MSWRELLIFFGEPSLDYKKAFSIYSLSQLAKYLPGNVFHLAGRQALGVAAGFSGKAFIKSIAGELGMHVFTCLFFVIFLLPMHPFNVPFIIVFYLFFINMKVQRCFFLGKLSYKEADAKITILRNLS